MKTIHILFRINGPDHPLLPDMGGKRELHQNAVYIRSPVQLVNQAKQLILAGIFRKLIGERPDSNVFAALLFVVHIDRGGRIRSNLHHGKRNRDPLFQKLPGSDAQFVPDLFRNRFTVYYFCHIQSPFAAGTKTVP